MGKRARKIQARSEPPNAGTKHHAESGQSARIPLCESATHATPEDIIHPSNICCTKNSTNKFYKRYNKIVFNGNNIIKIFYKT